MSHLVIAYGLLGVLAVGGVLLAAPWGDRRWEPRRERVIVGVSLAILAPALGIYDYFALVRPGDRVMAVECSKAEARAVQATPSYPLQRIRLAAGSFCPTICPAILLQQWTDLRVTVPSVDFLDSRHPHPQIFPLAQKNPQGLLEFRVVEARNPRCYLKLDKRADACLSVTPATDDTYDAMLEKTREATTEHGPVQAWRRELSVRGREGETLFFAEVLHFVDVKSLSRFFMTNSSRWERYRCGRQGGNLEEVTMLRTVVAAARSSPAK